MRPDAVILYKPEQSAYKPMHMVRCDAVHAMDRNVGFALGSWHPPPNPLPSVRVEKNRLAVRTRTPADPPLSRSFARWQTVLCWTQPVTVNSIDHVVFDATSLDAANEVQESSALVPPKGDTVSTRLRVSLTLTHNTRSIMLFSTNTS